MNSVAKPACKLAGIAPDAVVEYGHLRPCSEAGILEIPLGVDKPYKVACQVCLGVMALTIDQLPELPDNCQLPPTAPDPQ